MAQQEEMKREVLSRILDTQARERCESATSANRHCCGVLAKRRMERLPQWAREYGSQALARTSSWCDRENGD